MTPLFPDFETWYFVAGFVAGTLQTLYWVVTAERRRR